MDLIIVESPAKARTLSRFLGSGYNIEPTLGHIRDLPKDKIGIDTEHDFTPQYVVVKERKAHVAELVSQAKKADHIILATDPDREGEAIAWHVENIFKTSKGMSHAPISRIVFHEITKSAIEEALSHPRQVDMSLVDAQQARRVLDRLVGYKLCPLLWYKIRKGLSAGRVQSVTVRLIVEREREIEAFKPVEYWLIEAELTKQSAETILKSPPYQGGERGGSFIARLIEKDGNKLEVTNKQQADTIVAELEKASYVVSDIKKKEVRRFPYPPFTTSTMQQAGSNRFGWSAKKTMQVAQGLYESGFITYHRTDSTNIAVQAITMVRGHIGSVYGPQYLPDQPKVYKTKSKVAQEAHEAIRPTKLTTNNTQLTTSLGRDVDRLLDLITKRFVASQMKEAVYDQTSVDIAAATYTLRVSGSIQKFDGWQVLYPKAEKNDLSTLDDLGDVKTGNEPRILPDLSIEEKLNLERLIPQQKFTEPSPRFNEASLIKALEERGIGRPSTYAPTISTIQDRQYVEKNEKKFYATPLGSAVNDFLVTNFPGIIDYDFTAKMENQLDEIANGTIQWVPTIREFYTPFNAKLTSVYKDAKRVKIETEELSEKCPDCGNPLVLRLGKFGKFVACSTYPNCKYTRQYQEKAGIACPKCGGEIVVKKTKRGKRFYGCANYPTCTFAAWKKEDIAKISGANEKEQAQKTTDSTGSTQTS